MKTMFRNCPELLGLMLGLSDALFRAFAAFAFAPGEARVYGVLLLGNVHHHNEVRAFGLPTMAWFGIAAVVFAALYAGVRIAEYGARPGNSGFLLCRALLGVVAGVLSLNVIESLVTAKVTNYFGWVLGGRFTAINLGDVLTWLCLALLVPAFFAALTQYLANRARIG
jgi:hypothetical protein